MYSVLNKNNSGEVGKMTKVIKNELKLTKSEREKLKKLARSTDYRIAKRAQIILLRDEGKSYNEIGNELGVHYNTAKRWIKRFQKNRIKGLYDLPRPGRPRIFSEEVDKKILELLSKSPADYGIEAERWSVSLIREYLIENGIVESISVGRIYSFLRRKNIRLR